MAASSPRVPRDKTVRLWEASTGREMKVLRGHERQVFAVAFSRDGRTLATGSGDGTARLWEVATGREVAVLRGHENYVWSVAFTPDGGTLATGSSDNTVRLWDVATAREIGVLDGRGGQVFGGAVLAVAFSPDGQILASASAGSPAGPDDRPRLWPFGQGLLDHACARIEGLPFQKRDQQRFVLERQWCGSGDSKQVAAN